MFPEHSRVCRDVLALRGASEGAKRRRGGRWSGGGGGGGGVGGVTFTRANDNLSAVIVQISHTGSFGDDHSFYILFKIKW